jgi:hypothetical protein
MTNPHGSGVDLRIEAYLSAMATAFHFHSHPRALQRFYVPGFTPLRATTLPNIAGVHSGASVSPTMIKSVTF